MAEFSDKARQCGSGVSQPAVSCRRREAPACQPARHARARNRREAPREKRLGIEELCSRLGAAETTIRGWRFGHAQMPPDRFLRLVDLLAALDPDWVRRAKARRILVVDDHPDTAESSATLLKYLGHETQAVTDSRNAVRVAKEFRPQIALLDLGMPHIGGCELARMFRSDPLLKKICLVAVTAYDDEKHRLMMREAGFDAHVRKPADQYVLGAIISQFEDG
jgi:CheY-like chemotaxis protein